MNPNLPYHILNTAMIAGGVGFMLNMLHLVDFLDQFKMVHFLGLIGVAIFLKLLYGYFNSEVKDPITTNTIARRFFYLGIGLLATALVMRTYHLPYYKILLYLDIFIQCAALGISFSVKTQPLNEEILDS